MPKNGTSAPRKNAAKTVENTGFGAKWRVPKKKKVEESYGVQETFKPRREKHDFQTAELAPRKDKPRRLPARGENMSWEPTENLGIPYVS